MSVVIAGSMVRRSHIQPEPKLKQSFIFRLAKQRTTEGNTAELNSERSLLILCANREGSLEKNTPPWGLVEQYPSVFRAQSTRRALRA
jgi:hypothetical protein